MRARRPIVGFVVGLAVFFGLAWVLRAGLAMAQVKSAAVSQLVLKAALIVVALAGWAMTGRPFRSMGWKAPDWKGREWTWFVIGAVTMMAATVVMVFLGVRHPVASQLTFPQIVGLIWILSSLSEEIYVRGFVQSWIEEGSGTGPGDGRFSPAVVASAGLFAAMHASLMWSSAGFAGGLTIVLAMVGVGWACAVLRERTGSLWPAIACHIVANVAAVPGGIIALVLYRIILGRLPEFVSMPR
jgi:membrane protease YdiL (CAAX protease family)